jgi:6-phospho-beta-glucosidase
MRLVVVGGSAHSTPALWSSVVNDARLEGLQVVLMGRNRDHLRAVIRACLLLGSGRRNELSLALLDEKDWTRMSGADIVLIQLRNGGYSSRTFDETFPLRYGICGDEGLGPGGLSAGVRNWKAIRPALEQITRYAPHALVLIMSSPIGLMVRAAKSSFPDLKLAGICELPWTTLLDTCRKARVDVRGVSFDYIGVNHLGWLYGIQRGELIVQNAVPLKYMRLHQERENALHEQRAAVRSRGAELQEASQLAFAVYASGNRQEVMRCVTSRRTPWYEHAVGPLIASLAGRNVRVPFFLSVPNAGFDCDYRNDDVLEYPHTVDGGSLNRRPRLKPVPAHMGKTIRSYVEYERVGTTAVLSGRIEDIKAALARHPWVDGRAAVDEMAREMISHV